MEGKPPALAALAAFALPDLCLAARHQRRSRSIQRRSRFSARSPRSAAVAAAGDWTPTSSSEAWIAEAAQRHNGEVPPHAGSHRVGSGNFFEGIYMRISLPTTSFALITTTERFSDSDGRNGRGSIQVIGPGDEIEKQFIDDGGARFFSDPNVLCVGHWGQVRQKLDPASSARLLHPQQFREQVLSGYQITAGLHQGATTESARWDIRTKPLCSWGNRGRQARSTTTILSHLPIFDPGYQILMAHGVATGTIQWKGETYVLENAPCYSEKNWGRSFPSKWFWLQCNQFPRYPDLSVTAVGSTRKVLGREEKVGALFVHLNGKLISLDSWTCKSHNWEVEPWGSWKVDACAEKYFGSVEAWTESAGVLALGPTANGLEPNVRDSGRGVIRLRLMSSDGTIAIDTTSDQAAVEVGGGPWDSVWKVKTRSAPSTVAKFLSLLEGDNDREGAGP